MNRFDLQLFAVDTKTVKSADLAKVRDVDFTEQFVAGIQTLMTMLGVTRKLEKKAGETLKVYKVTGTLESGTVAEGEVIPLSKYTTSYTPIGEATLKKWRKVTTAEAISEKGYGQAVNDTNAKMLKDIQKGIRGDFVKFLATGTGAANGVGLQAAMAQVWGQMQVLFEDTSIETVYFMNPLDVADYLGSAQISTQTAFGMSYIQNFLGMGTAILASDVPKGKIYATAAENIVLLISHRLYLFPQMDAVIWMEDGRTVTGTHEELLARVPEYRALFESQAQTENAKDGGERHEA